LTLASPGEHLDLALQPTRALVRPVLTRLFQAYGRPERIRTDNGAPFASCALARLSQLSVWFLQCGIHPELIEPPDPRPPITALSSAASIPSARSSMPSARTKSLAMQPPATLYRRRNGGIRWQKAWVNVSHVLAEETVGSSRSPTDSGTSTIEA
jgi:hypothetical protein